MAQFKRRSKKGRITIVNRGSSLGITIGHSNIKRSIAAGTAGGLTKSQMAKSFDIYQKSEPGLLDKWGVLKNRKTQTNPYR